MIFKHNKKICTRNHSIEHFSLSSPTACNSLLDDVVISVRLTYLNKHLRSYIYHCTYAASHVTSC